MIRLVAGLIISLSAFVLTAAAPPALSPGTVVALQGTPHLWIAGDQGHLHWGGDTRALTGKHIAWSQRIAVTITQLRALALGDPWLSTGLLKDGDPIYLVKWETEWPLPKLYHIQSIADVELFGINASNYGRYVLDKATWEQRYGLDADTLERHPLAPADELEAIIAESDRIIKESEDIIKETEDINREIEAINREIEELLKSLGQ